MRNFSIRKSWVLKSWVLVLSSFFCAIGSGNQAYSQSPANSEKPVAGQPRVATDYGKLPLIFEANEGQSDAQVRFLSQGTGYLLFLTDSGAMLSLAKGAQPISEAEARFPGSQKDGNGKIAHAKPASDKPDVGRSTVRDVKLDVVRMELVDAAKGAVASGMDILPGTANYFVGNDPANWRTGVPTYSKVKYAGVYPGVDLVYYGNQRQLEYDFVVAAGADAETIRLQFGGAKKLRLDANGDLAIIAKDGEIAFRRPTMYQETDGKRELVEGHFALMPNRTVRFEIGAYDRSRALVIDPVLAYSTYLGGTGNDVATAIAVDKTGSTYVTGYTLSPKFPTSTSGYQKTNGNTTYGVAFVTKFNASGSGIIYSTYLGGSEGNCMAVNSNLYYIGDRGQAIAVDGSGEAYVSGYACSYNFPTTPGAFQKTNNGAGNEVPNVFVTKLTATGSGLVYSTYFGGSGSGASGDFGGGIAVDSSGNAYIAGQTYSHDFPVTPEAFQTTNDTYQAAFVAKLNSTGSAPIYSTYLGGLCDYGTSAAAIAIDAERNAYVTGTTYSTCFPTTSSAFQTAAPMTNNSGNAFVTKLNASGSALVYSTYLGGAGNGVSFGAGDVGNGIAVDDTGDAYVGGTTRSANFPITAGAFQKTHTNTSLTTGFVTKFNATGSAPLYSTYLGGTNGDGVNAIALLAGHEAFLTGSTNSSDFPTTNGAFQTKNNGTTNHASNAFLTELNTMGSALDYSTYLGGSGTTSVLGDSGNGVALDVSGSAYIAGAATSSNFPVTPGVFQPKNAATAGNSNAFVAKFEFATASSMTLTSNGTPEKLGAKVTFTADLTGEALTGTPTGTVDFIVDGGSAAAETLDDTGHATYSTTTLAEGVHKVIARYLGDATHLASTSNTVTETIYGAASAETIVSGSPQTVALGATSAPLVVIVKDAKGDVVPGVVVTFSGSDVKLSSTIAITGANGEAFITVVPTATGMLTVKAVAAGVTTAVSFTIAGNLGAASEPAVTQTITISEATSGATVYYTTDGTTPTTASKKYTGPITLTSTEMLKFIAVAAEYLNSAVRTVSDTVQ